MSNFNIIDFLKQIVSIGASDAHLYVEEYPSMRKDGDIFKFTEMPILTDEDLSGTVQSSPKYASSFVIAARNRLC